METATTSSRDLYETTDNMIVQAFQTHNHTIRQLWEMLIFPIWKQDQLQIYPTKHIGVVCSEVWD